MVLERLAEALGVTFRHYNASILNFDDLIGFPAPDADAGRVQYLRSDLDAWDAEAIFVDEISRCRPDMQNRLFPLIYDRKLQGAPLTKLKHRWSAMNPPPSEDDPNAYFGSFELDEAFADRYDWILRVPVNLSANSRLAIIKGTSVAENAAEILLRRCVKLVLSFILSRKFMVKMWLDSSIVYSSFYSADNLVSLIDVFA